MNVKLNGRFGTGKCYYKRSEKESKTNACMLCITLDRLDVHINSVTQDELILCHKIWRLSSLYCLKIKTLAMPITVIHFAPIPVY